MSKITKKLSQEEVAKKAIEIGKLLNGISIKDSDRVIFRYQASLKSNSIVSFVD